MSLEKIEGETHRPMTQNCLTHFSFQSLDHFIPADSHTVPIVMEKGVEITFNPVGTEAHRIVEALANLVGNEFREENDVEWRIFHVTLGEERFYKVCFTGRKLTRLHPILEKKVKERFDELAHSSEKELMEEYRSRRKSSGFRVMNIQDLKEEYDLWQDNFWKYF